MGLIDKKVIFESGDRCKVCATPVWYFDKQWYEHDNRYYVTCPCCGNEIQITEWYEG